MINRSNSPSLLRSRGGRTKSDSLVSALKKNSGSLTHGTLFKEPSLKALKAKKSQIEEGLPRSGVRRPLKEDGSLAKNARNVVSRREPKSFNEPKEFGPNMSRSARRGDSFEYEGFKRGGRASSDHWIQDAIKKPGSLKKTLHVKKGEKIPLSKLEKAEHSRSPLTRKRARLAETLRGFNHK